MTSDSRKVAPGTVFVAVAGSKADGAAYAADAAQARCGGHRCREGRGARHARGRRSLLVDDPRLALANSRRALSRASPRRMVAVTGTSGKTSVAAFTRQIWEQAGHAAASIGTTGVVAPGRNEYGSLTTPDPVELHQLLTELADAGVTHAAMEASSHGLDQRRLDGVQARRRRLHQSRPRPHGLSSDRRGLPSRQAAAVRHAAAEGRAGRHLRRRPLVAADDRRPRERPG